MELFKTAGGLLTALIAVSCYTSATAITCYLCNSEYDPRCGDPFDPYSLGQVNCSMRPVLEHLPHLEATLCRKTIQKVYGITRVVRDCGYVTDDRDDKTCMRRTGTHDVQAYYCSCTKDLCNEGSSIKYGSILTILTILTSMFLCNLTNNLS